MSITDFTPLSALVGGVMIGTASAAALALNGKIPGISGVFARIFRAMPGDTAWRVIFVLGLYLANLAARAVEASGQNPLLATAARVAITVLAAAMALRQMNVAENIIDMAFGLILGAAAIAAAIAFGMGGRDLARQELERWSQNLRSRSSHEE